MGAGQQALSGFNTAGSSYDSDAQAFFTAAGITDNTQKSAVNQLVLDLKAASLWTKFYAIYPFVGGDATKHSYNLKNPALYQITWSGGGITHDANGFTGNGSSGYGNTNLNQNSVISANNEHISVYSRTESADNTDVDIGVLSGVSNKGTSLQIRNATGNFNVYSQGTVSSTSLPSSLGYFSVNRTSSPTCTFAQGALASGIGITQDTLVNANFFIAAQNDSITGATSFSGRNYAWAAIGQGLTQTEDYNLYLIIQNFQIALSRQVLDYHLQTFLTATGITDATQKSALSTLVNTLKNYGIWAKCKAIYPFVGGTATTHKYNLKDAQDTDGAFRGVFNGTVTHNSDGITGNGSTGYMDTKLNGSAQSLNNDSHLSVYVRGDTGATNVTEIGAYNSASAMWSIKVKHSSTDFFMTLYRFATDGFVTGANASAGGFYINSRRSSSDGEAYKNGSSLGNTTTSTGQTIPNNNVAVGCLGGSVSQFSNQNIAFASIGNGLTDQQAADFFTAVEAFQDTLGRGVV